MEHMDTNSAPFQFLVTNLQCGYGTYVDNNIRKITLGKYFGNLVIYFLLSTVLHLANHDTNRRAGENGHPGIILEQCVQI